ncbi:TonB-dependent receptor [Undibacterium sp. TJN19]|uniref:TonB-dependent receptor n=1 Tax=Undibacterium sp. TJN19 TaxID=3413055 RepID=UPI003BEF734A
MAFQRTLMTSAILAVFAQFNTTAHAESAPPINTVTVTSNPISNDESMQVLTPAKVLSGPELKAKVGTSLGDTLSGELGVSASGFGAGASRPIIRGLEGPRVKILQNGMGVADVSSLSNDHAVASESATAQQIEILRGPAALLYGSGAIGGLVNVIDNRIPNILNKQITGEAEIRFGAVNQEKSASFSIDGSSGVVGLHVDGSSRSTIDYKIPGNTELNNPASASGRLPTSFTRESTLAVGASVIQSWGYFGVGLQTLNDHYGIPTAERSFIDLKQNRLDLDGLLNSPITGFDSLKYKLSATDYQHSEKAENGTAITNFKNQMLESRILLSHPAWAGWQGSWGLQSEQVKFSALSASTGRADTVPPTKSTSLAAFVVEQKQFGDVLASSGVRIENVNRTPDASTGLIAREFNLFSASLGGLWEFNKGYGAGLSLSWAQRAPATEELYSAGPHESTATFDIGNVNMKKEASRNIELSLQKTHGLLRWKINAFLNKVNNYVYGHSDGTKVDEEGIASPDAEFTRRNWSQAAASIRGGEAEISYNLLGEGLSLRAFADTSRGTIDNQGSLPLQPATRTGFDIGYKEGAWRAGIDVLRAQRQDRLASFESFVTPAYTKLDASLTYTHPYERAQLTWFLMAKNLLNQDIRLSTSVLKESVPQPGRNVMGGVRVSF